MSMSMAVAPDGGRPTAVPASRLAPRRASAPRASLAPESSEVPRASCVPQTLPQSPVPAASLAPLPSPVPGAPGLSECVSRLRVVVGEVVAAAGAARKAAAADPGVGAAAVGALAVLDEVATVLGVARA
ncbi:MAG TPA: hypothetical protein DHV14_09865, partial [Micrococcales bacterium]|nr:hypothetical protein [Micrococcales bacterium]